MGWACYWEDAAWGPQMRTWRRTKCVSAVSPVAEIGEAFVIVFLTCFFGASATVCSCDSIPGRTKGFSDQLEKSNFFWKPHNILTDQMESKLKQKTLLIHNLRDFGINVPELYILVHVCIFFIVLFVWIVDAHPIPTAASEEPSWLSLHHQSLTHPRLQKWNPTDICEYMTTNHHRFFFSFFWWFISSGLWF